LELQLLDSAVEPLQPSAPVRPPIIFGAAALGIIASVFAVLGANALRHRFDNAEEIRRRFGTSVLGEIPTVRRRHRVLANPRALFGGTGPPHVVEAFQKLRTNLEITLYAKPHRAVAITSIAPGEGKSLVTAHLGWVLASAGHDVLLIDADLRHPTLHKLLEQPFGDGVNIAAVSNPLGLVRSTASRSLRFVPAGVPVRHPAEVVGIAVPVLLDALGQAGRIILVDSPPLAGVAESSVVASVAGAVLLVIDARRPDFLDIERAIGDLRDKGAEVLGVVINRTRIRRRREAERYYHVPAFTPPEPPRAHDAPRLVAPAQDEGGSPGSRRAAQQ
jgi:capsular exopolysaccharide synthesis family protein